MAFLTSEVKSSIFMTGASSGIGLALAKRFVSDGHQVITVSRNQHKLDSAKKECHGLIAFKCDLSDETQRIQLSERIISEFPQVNVLINNAAVNKFHTPLLEANTDQDYEAIKLELNTNLMGYAHLSSLLLSHLASKPCALLANVTSVVAFCPTPLGPSYAATKAGMHSLTMSLRHQAAQYTPSVWVVEIIPPRVSTPMNAHLEATGDTGMDVNVFANNVVDQLYEGVVEIGYPGSEHIIRGSRDEIDALFMREVL